MKYYAVKIFVHTNESREFYKINDGEWDAGCPLDLMAVRPLRLNIEKIICYFPHYDKRATSVYTDGEDLIMPITFERFDEMVMNGEYLTTEENKIAK